MSGVRSDTFILKAHELKWAFGFGQLKNTALANTKQENSASSAEESVDSNFVFFDNLNICPIDFLV